jgi:hypothetical protein
MAIIRVLIGGLVLFLGRQLYWLFVGLAGFVLGLSLTSRYLSGQSDWVVILLALGAGVLGAILATFLQTVAIGVAGFIVGGYVLTTLLEIFNLGFGRGESLIYVIGGVLGALLLLVIFDWALIVLSSLAGATLIIRTVQFDPLISALAFLGLIILGIAAQASVLQGDRRKK